MALRVYVAAPFPMRHIAADTQLRLSVAGLEPTASWMFTGEKCDADLTLEKAREAARINDAAVDLSHAMLVLTQNGIGGETFVELGRAIMQRMPVVWVGERVVLSLRRQGCVRATSIDDAIAQLAAWSDIAARPWPTTKEYVRSEIFNLLSDADDSIEREKAA
jgi:hypothetical protein